jgi:hypothetical protein
LQEVTEFQEVAGSSAATVFNKLSATFRNFPQLQKTLKERTENT